MRKLLPFLLLLASPCYAGQRSISGGTIGRENEVISFTVDPPVRHRWTYRLVKSIGSQFKQTFYTDVREHPYAWGLQLGLRVGMVVADDATSCKGYAQGMPEVGPGRFITGSHPSCGKVAAVSAGLFAVNQMSVNWLAHSFKESCDRDAANPDSLWWKVDSHTKSTAACFWGPSLADTLIQGGIEIPAIRNNFNWLDRNKQFQKQCKEAQFCNP